MRVAPTDQSLASIIAFKVADIRSIKCLITKKHAWNTWTVKMARCIISNIIITYNNHRVTQHGKWVVYISVLDGKASMYKKKKTAEEGIRETKAQGNRKRKEKRESTHQRSIIVSDENGARSRTNQKGAMD